MTLPSTRRGQSTLHYAGGSITVLPRMDLVKQLETELSMSWPEIMQAMFVGRPVYDDEGNALLDPVLTKDGHVLNDKNGNPIKRPRYRQDPYLLVDVFHALQIGSSYTKNEINDWLLGDTKALNADPLKTDLAKIMANLNGVPYDEEISKVVSEEKKAEAPPTE